MWPTPRHPLPPGISHDRPPSEAAPVFALRLVASRTRPTWCWGLPFTNALTNSFYRSARTESRANHFRKNFVRPRLNCPNCPSCPNCCPRVLAIISESPGLQLSQANGPHNYPLFPMTSGPSAIAIHPRCRHGSAAFRSVDPFGQLLDSDNFSNS